VSEQERKVPEEEPAPKKGCLGCSFPLIIGIVVVLLVLFLVGFASGPLGEKVLGDVGLPSWLSVPQPHPELPAEVVFHPFGFPITNSISLPGLLLSSWLVFPM